MPLLPDNGKHNSVLIGLGVLEGCLCMTRSVYERGDEVEHDNNWEDERGFYYRHKFNPTFIEVLVMKEHGVGESWTSSFIISNDVGVELCSLFPTYGSLVPLCLTKNGEILFLVDGDEFLVYNPDKMSQRDIHIRFKTSDYSFHFGSYGASYVESLASPAAYGQEKDWIVKGSHALHLLCCTRWRCYSYESDDYSVFYAEEDNSVEEHDDCVLKGFWKKGKNKEKFVRKAKSRRYSSSGKGKNQEAQQRIRSKSKITFVRKNQWKRKQGKNMEVEDLHKQVLDFSVN
ncbi:hypothetical protein RHGRI_033106 [Rhododendron griersonianum]|uniref:F-box protein n=1 Tax=Rhododendron griersonianum TaxID=479676 RepID=A0AAV6I145_9ERIC|nr:hypothetical protein RHGRI_033106 [Rhododendron griersonianum]